MNRLRFLLLTALGLLGAAAPVRGAGVNDYPWAWLEVCNKGTVSVEVVVAAKNQDLLRGFDKYYWAITGTPVAPGKCQIVYGHSAAPAAYLAFGFYDAKGQWGSGTIDPVPKFGVRSVLFHEYPVLTSASKGVCARRDETEYRLDDDPQTDCTSLRLIGGRREVGHGPFFSLTSALYFEPAGQQCVEVGAQSRCNGGNYYLNISPSDSDRDLHAATGTSSGNDAAESADDSGATRRFLQALARAALEEHENEVKAAADAAEARRQYLMEQPAIRERQQKQILAAAAAGDPEAKVLAQMIEREAESNRQRRGSGTHQSPAAFDPQWTGHNVSIVGTVSRVDIDPSGSPQWVSIYFKESPDATFVVCSPYQDLFQERVGMNLSVLVGKTMEAAGQVEAPHCGQKASKGSIRVVESTQWQIH